MTASLTVVRFANVLGPPPARQLRLTPVAITAAAVITFAAVSRLLRSVYP